MTEVVEPLPAPEAPATPPAPPPTILGVDDTPPTPPTPQPVPGGPPAPEPEPAPAHKLTEEQYLALQGKAQMWDAIERDPQLTQVMNDHLQAKVRGEPQVPAATPPEGENDDPILNHPVVKQLMEGLQKIQEHNVRLGAIVQLGEFRRTHPDVDGFQDEMAKLITENGMNIEDSYRYAKAAAGKSQPVSAPAGPEPTAELRGTGQADEALAATAIDKARSKIMDPNAKSRNIGDYVDIAVAAAAENEGVDLTKGDW